MITAGVLFTTNLKLKRAFIKIFIGVSPTVWFKGMYAIKYIIIYVYLIIKIIIFNSDEKFDEKGRFFITQI